MQPTTADRAAIIDEFGELRRKIAEFQPTVKRAGELDDQIQSWYSDAPAEESFVAEGHKYTVQVSARRNQRTITKIRALFRFLGQRRFLDYCSFPLKAVDAHVPETEHPRFLEESRSGPRSLKPVAKAVSIDAAKQHTEERLAA